jgi:hypothetical protein
MNSNQTKTLLIASILAFALLSTANVSAPVFATGGLDDEEEEEAIETLQNAVEEINNSLEAISLNLTSGPNEIQANCPSVEEVVEEVVENITQNNNNVTAEPEQPECPVVAPEEPQQQNETQTPPTTIIPPVQNNVTEGCNPIPEPEQNETTSELEPIICPVNGELLGYTNTTSGEQLPISAGQNNETFIPIIDIPIEEEQPATEQNQTEQSPSCNVTAQPTQQEQEQPAPQQLQDEQAIATIEFEANCGCFVVDKSPEEVN